MAAAFRRKVQAGLWAGLTLCGSGGFAGGPGAGGTWLTFGAGIEPLKRGPRRAFGSLELARWSARRRVGVWASYDATTDSRWMGLGLAVGLPVGERGFLSLSSGPGWYPDQRTFDLGSGRVFRSTLTCTWRGGGRWEAGLALSHYSNGGAVGHNPGMETLRLVVGIPLGRRR